MKKDKGNKFIRLAVGTVAILIVFSACFIFLVFKANNIIDINADNVLTAADFDRTKVTSMFYAYDDSEGGSVEPGPPGPQGQMPGLPPIGGLTDVYNAIKLPAATNHTSLHDLNVYNGWPTEWGDSSVTVVDWYKMYDNWKADISTLTGFDKSSVNVASVLEVHADNYNSSSDVNIDGVDCLSTSFFPTWVDFNYYNKSFNGDKLEWYESFANSFYACFIFTDDTGKSIYVPITNGDAKGHTAVGGVCQTYISHRDFDKGLGLAKAQFANTIKVNGAAIQAGESKGGFTHAQTVKGVGVGDGDIYTCSIKDLVSLFVNGTGKELYYGSGRCVPKLALEVHSDRMAGLKYFAKYYNFTGIAVKQKSTS